MALRASVRTGATPSPCCTFSVKAVYLSSTCRSTAAPTLKLGSHNGRPTSTSLAVKCRNFCHWMQQQGDTFDDFLVSLRELAKTCNFCSDACCQKNIRDQIIQSLLDGQTVEDLLKEKGLTLAGKISKCQAQETAKYQWAEIIGGSQEPGVQTLQKPHPIHKQPQSLPLRHAQDADLHSTQVDASSAPPSTSCATHVTR